MSDEQERDGAPSEECVQPQSAQKGNDSFSAWDEFHEAFGDATPIPVTTTPDTGMPNLAPLESPVHAPPYTLEWFTCAMDASDFVVRGAWGEVIATVPADKVQRTPDGRWRAPTNLVVEAASEAIKVVRALAIESFATLPEAYRSRAPSDRRLLALMCKGHRQDDQWFEVRPRREQCKLLLQQLRPPAPGEELKYGWGARYCTARRTTTGAFMELTDDAIRACSMRDPVDQRGLELLDSFDRDQLKRSATRVHLPMFDFKTVGEGNIADEQKKDPSGGGIFGRPSA